MTAESAPTFAFRREFHALVREHGTAYAIQAAEAVIRGLGASVAKPTADGHGDHAAMEDLIRRRGVSYALGLARAVDREMDQEKRDVERPLALVARPVPTAPEVTTAPLGPGRPPYEEIQATGRTYGVHQQTMAEYIVRQASPSPGAPVIGSTSQNGPPDARALVMELELALGTVAERFRGLSLAQSEARMLLRALDGQDIHLRTVIKECAAHDRRAVAPALDPSEWIGVGPSFHPMPETILGDPPDHPVGWIGADGRSPMPTPQAEEVEQMAQQIFFKLVDRSVADHTLGATPDGMARIAFDMARAFYRARDERGYAHDPEDKASVKLF